MKKENKGILLIILASILWGNTGTTQAFMVGNYSPLAVGTIRMIIGGATLTLYAFATGSFKKSNAPKSYAAWILTIISVTLYQPFFFSAVNLTGVGLGTIVGIGSAPIFSGIIETLRGNKLTKSWYLSTSFSIVGCIFLFADGENVNLDIRGLFFALGAGLSYAMYVMSSSKLLTNHKREKVNAIVFGCSALLLTPILFFVDLSFLSQSVNILALFHLGVATTAVAYSLFAMGLKDVAVSKAVTLTLTEPLTAAILSVAILREPVTANIIIGTSLVFIGLYINTKEKTS